MKLLLILQIMALYDSHASLFKSLCSYGFPG